METHIFFGIPSILYYVLTTVLSMPFLFLIVWQFLQDYNSVPLLGYVVCIALNIFNTVFFLWHNLVLKFIFTSKLIIKSLPKSKLYFLPSAIQTLCKVVYTVIYMLLVKYESSISSSSVLPLIMLFLALFNFTVHLMIVPAQNKIVEYEEIALNWGLIITTSLNLQFYFAKSVPNTVEITYTLIFAAQSFIFPYLLRYFMTVRVWNKLVENRETTMES